MLELAIFLFSVLLMLFLGGVVFVNEPKNQANRLFFLFVLYASGWMITNFVENVGSLPFVWRMLFLQFDFMFGVYGTAILFLFALTFSEVPLKQWHKFLITLPGIFMMIISLTPLLLSAVFIREAGDIGYQEGPLYTLYGVVILSYVIGSAVVLTIARRYRKGAIRKQMKIVAISLIVTLFIAIPINFFFQNDLPYQVLRIGIYSFLIFVGGSAYAIARHKFLGVRFLVMEIFLLGMLATILTRLILSTSVVDFFVNFFSAIVLLILGMFLIRSVLREIKQREELEVLTKKLKSANTKLKRLDQLKTEFLSIASHELRTPMSVIRGYVSMIEEGSYGKFSKKQLDALGKIHNSVDRLINLVTHLLNVSRIESGKTTLQLEAVDLFPVCQESSGSKSPLVSQAA